jgi:hypothetical protein
MIRHAGRYCKGLYDGSDGNENYSHALETLHRMVREVAEALTLLSDAACKLFL